MKVLLTDDERMVRLGLIDMLEELYPGQHEYKEARDGREMLEEVERFQPDISFVDIRMPRMDGLQALERCHKLSPHTQYLILSGYSDFEYARTGLQLGAMEYLLKPVSPEELRESMDRAFQRVIEHYQQANAQFAHTISTSYNSGLTPCLSGPVDVAIFFVDGCLRQKQSNELYLHLQSKMESTGNGRHFQALFHGRENALYLVTQGEAPSPRSLLEGFPLEHSVVTAFWEKAILPEHFADRCAGLAACLPLRLFVKYGKVALWDQSLREKLRPALPLASALEELATAYQAQLEIEYKDLLNQVYRNAANEALFALADPRCLEAYFATAGLQITASSFKEMVYSLIDSADRIYQAGSVKEPQDEIEWVKSYIQKNYMLEIECASIAQTMGISPNYLSKIFHERTGSKFISYLTDVRITNAKRLFAQQPDLTVKEVANQVGYISVRHFTKTFTRIAGCLPSEYQAQAR